MCTVLYKTGTAGAKSESAIRNKSIKESSPTSFLSRGFWILLWDFFHASSNNLLAMVISKSIASFTGRAKGMRLSKNTYLDISMLQDVTRSQRVYTFSTEPTKYDQQLPLAWKKTAVAETPEDLQQAYAEWSESYDKDSVDRYGYVGPRRGAEEFQRQLSAFHFTKDSRLADVGAGTGLVGKHLHDFGYHDLTAVDFSKEMLREAAKKKIYSSLIHMDLNWDLEDISANAGLSIPAFDAAVSVGTFTKNHVGVKALLNVIALVKPEGLLTISFSEMFYHEVENGVQYKLRELEHNGKLEFVDVTDPELYTPKISDSIKFRVWSWIVKK